MSGNADVEQSSTSRVQRHADVQNPEHRRHRHTEVAGHERLAGIPHEARPALAAGLPPSLTGPAGQVPAHGARGGPHSERQPQCRRGPSRLVLKITLTSPEDRR